MEISSGIIVYRINMEGVYEFFMCTPQMPYKLRRQIWSFPKGHVEEGETPFETAVREFTEETSVILSNLDRITYLGLVRQNNRKKVHVFIKPYEDEDFTNLDSNECITVIDGVEYKHKEIEDYAWMTYDELESKGLKCYQPLLKTIMENGQYH